LVGHASDQPKPDPSESKVWIVYDGACPFSSAFVKRVRLRQAIGPVGLVDARQGGPLVDEINDAGLDLDQGMVLKIDGRLYHGDECLHMLALLSTPSSLFNRFSAAVFRSRTASRLLYPVLRSGRDG